MPLGVGKRANRVYMGKLKVVSTGKLNIGLISFSNKLKGAVVYDQYGSLYTIRLKYF